MTGLMRSASILLLLAWTVLTVGCSSGAGDDPDTPQPTPGQPGEPDTYLPILFSALQQEEDTDVTRATSLEDMNVFSFTVWGYKNLNYNDGAYDNLQTVFPGYTVNWVENSANTTSSNTHGWEYVNQQTTSDEQTIKYWDWGAKAYRFLAVTGTVVEDYGGTYEANKAYKANEANGTKFTFAANCSGATEEAIAANIAAVPYFSRLWFSTGNVGEYPDRQFGKPVQLEFTKPFARVRFLFNYSYAAEGVRVTSPNFKPADNEEKIALVGTVTVSYPLTGTATKESYSVTPKAVPAAGETLNAFTEEYIPEGTEKWYTVLPALSQGNYTMNVIVNNNERTAVVPAAYMSWLPGYSYTYIFKITEDGGVEIDLVQSAVTPWTELENDHSANNW